MRIIYILIATTCCLLWSCKKESFTTSSDASLITGDDTLKFDTVFTTLGSITQAFTIVNDNNQKLRISNIKLGGGASSFFKMNVDGVPGTDFSNIELNANDSMYVFVKVTIDPSITNQPFVVNDSITITYNGNTVIKQLEAYGQNANFINAPAIAANTTWTNEKPYVILNTITVNEGITLTLEKGTRVYCNATAGFVVNGNLICNGDVGDSNNIIFRGDRLDAEYRDLPAGWPGLTFGVGSQNNIFKYTNILNAYRAVILNPSSSLIMNECIIDNAYDFGLFAARSTITATNCLISQCGNEGTLGNGGSNVILTAGGNYSFTHCTFATYSNLFQNHKQPVMYISDSYESVQYPLTANFFNSIIYGEGGFAEDELVINKTLDASVIKFENILYKTKTGEVPNATLAGEIITEKPEFDTINTSRREYNFRLKESSPAIDKGTNQNVNNDLDGNPRPYPNTLPDLGCYEKQQ